MGTHYNGNQAERHALDSYIKLHRAVDTVTARIDRETQLGDLRGSPFGVLEMLYHLGPIHQKTIGEKLLISKSNVVAVIDKLEKRKMVCRQRSTEDRRCVFVHLTEDGREQVESLLPHHVACIARAMSRLSVDEQRQLGDLCRKLGRDLPE